MASPAAVLAVLIRAKSQESSVALARFNEQIDATFKRDGHPIFDPHAPGAEHDRR